jgi:hypothetical protein
MNKIHEIYTGLDKSERRTFKNRFRNLFNIYSEPSFTKRLSPDYKPSEAENLISTMILDEIKDGR